MFWTLTHFYYGINDRCNVIQPQTGVPTVSAEVTDRIQMPKNRMEPKRVKRDIEREDWGMERATSPTSSGR